VKRVLLLLGLSFKTRMRGFASAGASSILLVLGALFYVTFTCLLGVAAFAALSQLRAAGVDRVAGAASLVVTLFGVFFLTRPLLLGSLAGGSLQNLLHLPIQRRELLLYSLLTGVVTPLILESPVLIGAAMGAASHPGLVLLTLPLALIAHLTLLAGAHAMSLLAILIAHRAWIADLARILAFGVLLLPSLMSFRPARELVRPLAGPLMQLSPLGWAARAAVHAGAGDLRGSLIFAAPALLLLAGIVFVSLVLLNRVLDGEARDSQTAKAGSRRARVLLPGGLGALIETQVRSQLRTPAARMALFMPTLMMAFFAFSLSRQSGAFSPFALVLFMSLAGGNAFLMIGRGVALILGTPVSRASVLMASDAAAFIFRAPPILAIIAVVAWRSGPFEALSLAALALALIPVSTGVQHFVSILRPFSLPRDRLNPFAQRVDSRQSGHGLLSLVATLATLVIASPFILLHWLSSRVAEGAYAPLLVGLGCLGAFAVYAVLIALAERLLVKRELQVLEVLLDDSPG
jgi:hypothetical protein